MRNATLNRPAPGLLNEEYTFERLKRCLDFTNDALLHLIVDGHPADEEESWYVRPEKIIAESAFLMVFANPFKHQELIRTSFQRLGETLEPLGRSKAMLLNICLKPSLALDYAHTHICLDVAGFPNAEFDALVESSLKGELINGIERTPYRILERFWLLNLRNTETSKTEREFWIQHSALCKTPDIFSESTDAAYALTHAVMYHQENDIFDREKLAHIIEAMLIRNLDAQDYDVAGELLISWIMLGLPLTDIIILSLEILFTIEKRVGFLPAPGLDTSKLPGLEKCERRTYIFSINYHTILVMGLLCCVMLHRKFLDGITTVSAAISERDKSYLEELIQTAASKHWIEFYYQHPKTYNWAPFIYHALLSKSIREKNFSLSHEILQKITSTSLKEAITSGQANELLARLSRFSG